MLVLASCTKEDNTPIATPEPPEIDTSKSPFTYGFNFEGEDYYLRKQSAPQKSEVTGPTPIEDDCGCFFSVRAARNTGADPEDLWGLGDITYNQSIPFPDLSGNDNFWGIAPSTAINPLPSPFFEFDLPSTGNRKLVLSNISFAFPLEVSLDILVHCGEVIINPDGQRQLFSLARTYGFTLNFQDGDSFGTPFARTFDIFVDCEVEDISAG